MTRGYRGSFAACFADPAYADLTAIERTGVTDLHAGWIKNNTASEQTATIDAQQTGTGGDFKFEIGYYYAPALPTSGDYQNVRRYRLAGPGFGSPANYDFYLRFVNDAGTLKFKLYEDATERDASGAISAGLHTILVEIQHIGPGYTQRQFSVYVDGTLELQYTHTAASDLYVYDDRPINFGGGTGAFAGYWSTWGLFDGSASADFTKTDYPESYGHVPNSNGDAFYNDYTGVPETSAKWQNWDDFTSGGLNDGDTTYNGGNNAADQEQVGGLTTITYANTIVGMTEFLVVRANSAGKAVPHEAILREAGTDRKLTLPTVGATSYAAFVASFNDPPNVGWTQAKVDNMQAGHGRDGADANLFVTALAVEGYALGSTIKAPPAPPGAAAGQPFERRQRGSIVPTGAQRIGRGW